MASFNFAVEDKKRREEAARERAREEKQRQIQLQKAEEAKKALLDLREDSVDM